MAAPLRFACSRQICKLFGLYSRNQVRGAIDGLSALVTLSPRQCSATAAPFFDEHPPFTGGERSRPSRFNDRNQRDDNHSYQRRENYNNREDGEEEELEYNINEEEIDSLRRQHREDTRSQTLVEHGKSFSDFPICESLRLRLDELGYHDPFEIQAKTLPHTLNGRDVIGRALTGSGKTLAFSIPIVETIMRKKTSGAKNSPRAIVISPTRELCLQIFRSVQELNPSIRCLPVYGGESVMKQRQMIMSRGVDIVCATPGRLKDHLQNGVLRLDSVEFLCLDEADHLLTPDFLVQIENVLQNTPSEKQVMLFSATMPSNIQNITRKYMSDAVYIDLASVQKAPSNVRHLCMEVPWSYHVDTVTELLKEQKPERCIVFIRTKVQTKMMAASLRAAGMNASELHSDLSQAKRTNILSAFRTGKVAVLVATDVAARGLDVPEVDLVIQVEPPANGTDFYIHRSGRTGRAGRDGLAVMIHCGSHDEKKVVQEIADIVKLEHALPPNYEKLQFKKMSKALRKLEEIPEDQYSAALPLLDKVSEGDGTRRLLAAAISLLKDSELLGSRRSDQGGFRNQNQGGFRNQNQGGFRNFNDNHHDRFSTSRDRFVRRPSHRHSNRYQGDRSFSHEEYSDRGRGDHQRSTSSSIFDDDE